MKIHIYYGQDLETGEFRVQGSDSDSGFKVQNSSIWVQLTVLVIIAVGALLGAVYRCAID